jgi:hypothetical protein
MVRPGAAGGLRISSSRDGVSNEILTLRGGKGVVVRWKRKDAVEIAESSSNPNNKAGGVGGGGVGVSVVLDQLTTPNHLSLNKKSNNQLRRAGASRIKRNGGKQSPGIPGGRGLKFSRAIRSTYTGKSIESKKKVIRMLFVLVAEFFLCWTPLYVMHTWYLFSPDAVYNTLSPLGISLVQLLAYISSCCNPIT